MKRILSISGGGMRGIIPAVVAVEIERRTSKPLCETFDLIGGTSTGGIIATLAAAGISAVQARQFYYERGPKIFKSCPLKGLFGIAGPKYDGRLLMSELKSCIGATLCRDAKTKIILPTVDADAIEAVFIKSWDDFWLDFPLWEAAVATSSAQTFFPSFSTNYRGKNRRYFDGGNHSNNPLASAVFEARRLWPKEELHVMHLGTGRGVRPKPLPDGGLAAWAPLVFGTMSECQDDLARYFTADLPGVVVEAFDLTFSKNPPIDNASRATLALMERETKLMIRNNSSRLDAILRD